MHFSYHSACVSAFWGSLFGKYPMADLGGIILGSHATARNHLLSENESYWSFWDLSWWVFWNSDTKVVQFRYKKHKNSTKQIVNHYWSSKVSYRELFCHTFLWNVKPVISPKTCDCTKIKQKIEKYDFQCQSFMVILPKLGSGNNMALFDYSNKETLLII